MEVNGACHAEAPRSIWGGEGPLSRPFGLGRPQGDIRPIHCTPMLCRMGRVGGAETPAPYNRGLEAAAIPDAGRVVEAIERLYGI